MVYMSDFEVLMLVFMAYIGFLQRCVWLQQCVEGSIDMDGVNLLACAALREGVR